MDNKELVEEKLKEHSIEVVISVMGGPNILDQLTLIDAIKSVPTIKVCTIDTFIVTVGISS